MPDRSVSRPSCPGPVLCPRHVTAHRAGLGCPTRASLRGLGPECTRVRVRVHAHWLPSLRASESARIRVCAHPPAARRAKGGPSRPRAEASSTAAARARPVRARFAALVPRSAFPPHAAGPGPGLESGSANATPPTSSGPARSWTRPAARCGAGRRGRCDARRPSAFRRRPQGGLPGGGRVLERLSRRQDPAAARRGPAPWQGLG